MAGVVFSVELQGYGLGVQGKAVEGYSTPGRFAFNDENRVIHGGPLQLSFRLYALFRSNCMVGVRRFESNPCILQRKTVEVVQVYPD